MKGIDGQGLSFTIAGESARDAVGIAALLDEVFGTGRFVRAAYRLREGRAPVHELSFVAHQDGGLAGSVRFWPICVGERRALLLGPIAVAARYRGQGIARALIEHGCEAGRAHGHDLVILVGDEAYYRASGFAVLRGEVMFPGHVDYERLLVRPLREGAERGLSGVITALRPAASKFCGYESVMIEEGEV